MLKITAALFLLTATAANAGGLTVKDCALLEDLNGHMACSFTNETNTPIDYFTFKTTVIETGRTIPWVKPSDSLAGGRMAISGGLEPGETAKIFIRFGYLDERANREKLDIDVEITGIFDVNGAEITN
jgi:hypothetical protein